MFVYVAEDLASRTICTLFCLFQCSLGYEAGPRIRGFLLIEMAVGEKDEEWRMHFDGLLDCGEIE